MSGRYSMRERISLHAADISDIEIESFSGGDDENDVKTQLKRNKKLKKSEACESSSTSVDEQPTSKVVPTFRKNKSVKTNKASSV